MAHFRIFRHYFHVPFAILGLLDLAVLILSLYVAVFFRFFGDWPFFVHYLDTVLPSALFFGLANLVVMVAVGVHQAKVEEGLTGMMLRSILAVILSLPLSTMAYLGAPKIFWYLGGEGVLPAASVFALFIMGIVRMVFFTLAGDDSFKRNILILGAGERARRLLEDLSAPMNRKGFRLEGCIPLAGERVLLDEIQLFKTDQPLKTVVLEKHIDEIVVAVDDRRKGLPMDELLECKMEGVGILDGANFYERESRKVALEMISQGWLVFSDGFNLSTVAGVGKRSIDLFASLTLLAITWPFMLLTVMAIKIEEGWRAPVLYSQERVGLGGKPFPVHKFRSMRTDAESGGAVWARKNDTRVTKVGAFIRKVRIDELPQIFNVIKGDMAFVGPRPERPVFVNKLAETIPFYNERHRVKPGITGWAQLCFAYADNEEDSREKLRYDLYYIKNQSLLLDLLIILQTVEVILFKKGSR